MSHDIQKFKTEGLVNVSYPAELRNAVEVAMNSWKKFCELPEEVRIKFPYLPNSVNGSVSGVGYELKKVPGATLDQKEDFHFTLAKEQELLDTANSISNEIAAQLIVDAKKLTEGIQILVNDFALKVEKEFSIEGFADEIERSHDVTIIRFLHYFGGASTGEEIAKAHSDKSGFTLHLYESDPGLQYLDRSYNWQEMPVSHEETVIIPGMRGQYRSKGELKATSHRVIATSDTAKTGRYSAVAFVHLKDTPQYNKAGAGRLQEFKPGFNYEMPFEEFSKLFI